MVKFWLELTWYFSENAIEQTWKTFEKIGDKKIKFKTFFYNVDPLVLS